MRPVQVMLLAKRRARRLKVSDAGQRMGRISGGLLFAALALSCGGQKKNADAPRDISELGGQSADDRARCEYLGRDDRDVQESSVPGAVTPNVRRVYGYIGVGSERKRVLLCREVDTNFDGVKDLLRTYGDNGEKLTELADSDYDGRIDTWITFGPTRPSKIDIDKNGDGKADESRFYAEGKLLRIQRDTNADDKPDVFEIYEEGHLQRVGTDTNFDGQVDVWHRDEGRARAAEQAEQEALKKEETEKSDQEEQAAPSE